MEPTDATIIGEYFLNYIKSISTCFVHYYAHHQETRKREWLTHAHIAAPYNCSQHNQVASHEVLTSLVSLSPDDGHNNARNMERLI
jgi:hypothetical protein